MKTKKKPVRSAKTAPHHDQRPNLKIKPETLNQLRVIAGLMSAEGEKMTMGGIVDDMIAKHGPEMERKLLAKRGKSYTA